MLHSLSGLARCGHLSVHERSLDVRGLFLAFAGGRATQGRAGHLSQLPLRDQQDLVLSQSSRGEDSVRVAGELRVLSRDVSAECTGDASARRVSGEADQVHVQADRVHVGGPLPRD